MTFSLDRFDHHYVAYQSILLRLKESQEGDLLATSLEEKQLNKELSRRSKNFRIKIKIRVFLYLQISVFPLKPWTPSRSKRKPHMLRDISLLFYDTFSLVISGCIEKPKLTEKPSPSNCLAPRRQNNLSHELQTTSTFPSMRWAQRGRLPSSNCRQELRGCEQTGTQAGGAHMELCFSRLWHPLQTTVVEGSRYKCILWIAKVFCSFVTFLRSSQCNVLYAKSSIRRCGHKDV